MLTHTASLIMYITRNGLHHIAITLLTYTGIHELLTRSYNLCHTHSTHYTCSVSTTHTTVEPNSGDGGYLVTQLELIEHCCFASTIKPQHEHPHLLLPPGAPPTAPAHTHGAWGVGMNDDGVWLWVLIDLAKAGMLSNWVEQLGVVEKQC